MGPGGGHLQMCNALATPPAQQRLFSKVMPNRATQAGWKTLKYYELIIAPIAILFLVFAPQIINTFNNYPDVVNLGSTFLRFIAITLPFLASALILSRGINGAGDTIAPAVLAGIAQLGLRIPIAYALVYIFGMGTNGIWLAINVSDICQGLIMIWYFKRGFWQKRYHKHRDILEDTTL